MYRARVQINHEEPLDGFVKLTYRSDQEECFDRMARDMNLVPSRDELKLPQDQLRECMRSHAKKRYLSRVERWFPPRHTRESFAEETFVKGIFKTKLSYGHSAEIRDDATVHVRSFDRKHYKDLLFPFGDESIARDIARMKDIIEVACTPQGLFALDDKGEVHYAGRDRQMQERVRQVSHVKSIALEKDSVYALTVDGQLVALGQCGVTAKEKGVKALSTLGSGDHKTAVYIDAHGDVRPNNRATAEACQRFIALDCCGDGSAYLSECGQLYYNVRDVTLWIALSNGEAERKKNEENRKRLNHLKKAFGIVSFEMLSAYHINPLSTSTAKRGHRRGQTSTG